MHKEALQQSKKVALHCAIRIIEQAAVGTETFVWLNASTMLAGMSGISLLSDNLICITVALREMHE